MKIPPTRMLVVAALLVISPMTLVGANGLGSDPLAGYPEGSYVLEDGGVAIPLRQDVPDWYTPEVHQRIVAASDRGLAYDVLNRTEVPVATQFLFIRPGAWMQSPSGCTMNFIYGTPNNYKIGSAGHCNAVNSVVTVLVYPGIFAAIGKTTASHNNGIGDDWSIVTIYPQWQQYVDANVAVIGGPQGGAFTGSVYAASPLPLKHIGHGLVIGTGGTPRAGVSVAAHIGDPAWWCFCAVIYGDSGSPILVAGSADHPLGQGFGVITHLVTGSLWGTSAGTRLTAIPETIRNGDINPLPPA